MKTLAYFGALLLLCALAARPARAHEIFYLTTHSGANIARYDTSGTSLDDALNLSTVPVGGNMHEMRDAVVGPDGNLYVANSSTNPLAGNLASSIVRFSWNGTGWDYLDAFATPASSPNLQHPFSIAFASGNLFVTNQNDNKALAYSTAGLGVSTPTALSSLFTLGPNDVPRQALFGPNGNLFLANEFTNSVQQYDSSTGVLIGNFTQGGSLQSPSHILFDGAYLYVNSPDNNKIERFDATTGAYVDDFINDSHLDKPSGFAFSDAGDFYVLNRKTDGKILKYQSDGSFDTTLVSDVEDPEFIVFVTEPPTTPVPEPAAAAELAGLVMLSVGGWRILRKRRTGGTGP